MRAVVALGSNLGNRRGHLEWAIERLKTILGDVRVSSFHETDPVDVPEPQPPYLNAALSGTTTLDPVDLLRVLLALERERGRTRPGLRSPRTLDLDLILYGHELRHTPELTLPHPRYRERRFVLAPLAEIEPELIDPATGETVGEMLRRLED